MAVASGYRSQNSKVRKQIRKRRESEEENIFIDLNREPVDITREVLIYVVNQDINKTRKLVYLNGFARLCTKKDKTASFGYTYKDIFCCFRVALFHETCEVRAASLRACRYLLENDEALDAFLLTKLQFLVCRSLDIMLDNRLERIQALRLMRKILALNPLKFPRAFTNCLVAIANEGNQERDLLRPSVATLSQIALLNPKACIEANGISALMRNILDNSQPETTEATLGVILYLLNYPETRNLICDRVGLEHLLAPFTDCHYHYPNDILENSTETDRGAKLNASKSAIVCTLLSWSGLTYLCRTDCSHLQSLIEMLFLPYSELRGHILDLLYKIFDVPIPEWTDDFNTALNSINPSSMRSTWHIFEGYVVTEAIDILPYTSKYRTNLVENFYSILLLVFVHSGLLEALAEVIVTADIYLAVRATIFLGEFIYMANQFLPVDCSHLSNCLPSLIAAAASFESSREQHQASASLTCLFRIHELKLRGSVPNSLVLSSVLHMCRSQKDSGKFFAGVVNRMKLRQYLKKETMDGIEQAIKDTQVLTKDFHSWDWNLIDCIVKNPSDALRKVDDGNHRTFVKKLLHFFKPNNKEFSEIEFDKDNARLICVTGCHFLEFLLEIDEGRAQEYLDDLLHDFNGCLLQVTKDDERLNAVLSPIKVLNTLSQMYFLFVGKLSSTHKGCKYLNRCLTFQNLFKLVSVTKQEIYIKLVISSLDYSKEGFARSILNKVLTGTELVSRLYATQYLRVLLRAGLSNFHKWAIELLVTQLYDPNKLVSAAAVDILDEACNVQENLEALISFRPSLLHVGDKGLLLLLRFLSVPIGFSFLRDSNFLHYELGRWQQIYNIKYVKIVEDLLNEAFTHHRRSENGTYGRRSSDISHPLRSVYLPPHIYGQLAQHADGIEVLEKEEALTQLFSVIHNTDYSSDAKVLQLKAALWAVGHIGSSTHGLALIQNENLIPLIAYLAAESPVLSVRGTTYFVLGLLCSTPEGSAAVGECGWEAVRRNHEEKWPLIKEELSEYSSVIRKSTWSFSSAGSEWPVGALPMSLSFIVRPTHNEISGSQSRSSHCSSDEALQNSFTDRSIIITKTKAYSFGHTLDLTDSRPRSSSDCHPERKLSSECQMTESASWDALNKSIPSSLDSTHDEFEGCKRSASSAEMHSDSFPAISEESQPDRNVNFYCGEPRSESREAEASLGNATPNPVAPRSPRQPPKILNIVPNLPLDAASCEAMAQMERPTLLKQLSQGYTTSRLSPTSPMGNTASLLTNSRDALGYATLKNIQKRRALSLSFHEPETTNVNVVLHRAQSHYMVNEKHAQNYFAQDSFSHGSAKSKGSISFMEQAVTPSENFERYIGLCLPSKLSYIFSVPVESKADSLGVSKETEPLKGSSGSVFDFHTEENCIVNHSSLGKRVILNTIIDEEREELADSHHEEQPNKCQPARGGAQQLPKNAPKLKEDNENAKHLIRKEAMRFVTNLCSSIAVKNSEQGLLSLKHKFPEAFQDICLYTEISFYIANYNFRLPARRFMQELFLDITFEELLYEAESIIGKTSIPHLGGGDATLIP